MAQILPAPPSIGELFGTGLGQGLGSGLQQLAQQKLQQIQQRNLGQVLKAANLPQEYAYAPESILKELIKSNVKQTGNDLYGLAQAELGGYAPQQQQQLEQLLMPQAEQQNPMNVMDFLGQGQPVSPVNQQLQQRQPVQPEVQQPSQPTMEQRRQIVNKYLADPRLSPSQKESLQKELHHLEDQDLKKQIYADKLRSSAFKETKEERKEIINKARAARQNIQDLNRLEELNNEGKLDTPGYLEFLKRSGLDIPALMNPESQEFQKITQTFLRDAKTYLGARISNFELEQFLKTIPSLSQSPEGRKRVIANLKNINRTALAYNDALKEVMKENKGIPPYDLAEQIDDRISPKLDKISKKLKEDLAKPVPEGQGGFTTAIQSLAGNAFGRLPKAAAGAGIGYKFAGPYGALAGGLAGLSGLGLKDILPI